MGSELHWSIWLFSGMALGLVSGMGESSLFGLLTAIGILCAPVVIYMNVGAAFMPFALFFGGLAVVASLLYKRRAAKDHAKLRADIEAKKRSRGR